MKRVGVIGLGFVGGAVCHSLIDKGMIDELYLYDINAPWLKAQYLDLLQASVLNKKKVTLKMVSLKDLNECDILVNTASAKVLSPDRLQELSSNRVVVKDIFKELTRFKGLILNVSNPCDIISCLITEETNICPSRVLGTGTLLDSIRLKTTISSIYNVEPSRVKALAMGEHGSDLILALSTTTIDNLPFFTYLKENNLTFNEEVFKKEVTLAGSNIFSVKHRTEYGIASCVTYIIEALFSEDKTQLPLSAPIMYKDKLIYTSRPVYVNKDGYVGDGPLTLNEIELTRYEEVKAKQFAILYLK